MLRRTMAEARDDPGRNVADVHTKARHRLYVCVSPQAFDMADRFALAADNADWWGADGARNAITTESAVKPQGRDGMVP